MKPSKGFTLTELLIVIAILGILASIAMPQLFPQTERARASETIAILSAIRQGEEAYRLERGVYLPISTGTSTTIDADWRRLGLENPNTDPGRFFNYSITTPTTTTFTATATRRSDMNPGGTQYGSSQITFDQTAAWGGTAGYFIPD